MARVGYSQIQLRNLMLRFERCYMVASTKCFSLICNDANAILDRLNCTLNEQVSFFEKAKKLSEIKRLCQETLSADYKAKRGIEREVFVCNFA